MTRKPSQWNLFVKKVYQEGKAKDKNYEFKQALVDASKRKSEIGHSTASVSKKSAKTKKSGGKNRSKRISRTASASASMSISGGKRTRRHKKH